MCHTCGYGRPLLDDLAAMGVHAIWPQLNSYPEGNLERFCRESRVAIALHPERGELMTRSTPADVRHAVERLHDRFGAAGGGAWFYVEIEAGFPLANVSALIESIARLRGEI